VAGLTRDERIVARYASTDLTLAQVGAEFGLTKQRVSKIIPPRVKRARAAALTTERACAAEVRRLVHSHPCVVCGQPTSPGRRTDTETCAAILDRARRHLNPVARRQHIAAVAGWVLRNQDRADVSPHRVAWARRHLAGQTAPRPLGPRRGSLTYRAIVTVRPELLEPSKAG
jgi:predicted nucleic acid-binding Zn ribbon protein